MISFRVSRSKKRFLNIYAMYMDQFVEGVDEFLLGVDEFQKGVDGAKLRCR